MRVAIGTLGAALLSVAGGCSTLKEYPGDHPPNMSIQTTTRSGSVFERVRPYLHLYKMKNRCEVEYLGTVHLDGQSTEIGIEPGQMTYLKFVFKRTETFGGGALIEYTTIVTPRAGTRYAADVRYLDRSYDVKVREVDRNGTPIREFSRQSRACPAASVGWAKPPHSTSSIERRWDEPLMQTRY